MENYDVSKWLITDDDYRKVEAEAEALINGILGEK